MGMYLNPGNSGFEIIRNSRYVDKSGLIGLMNETIETTRKLTCISRPRRFGKTFAAKMLCAYYDRTCDSSMLFDDHGGSWERRAGPLYQEGTDEGASGRVSADKG